MLDSTEHNATGNGLEKPVDAPVVVTEPALAPNGKKKGVSGRWFGDWKNKPKPTFGEALISDLDPEGGILTDDQRAKILQIPDVEALKSILYADLGDLMNADISTAEKVFGKFLMSKFEIPPILMTLRFSTIAECQSCIQDHTLLMRDKTLTGAERVNAGKARTEAIKAQNTLLMNLQGLARVVGALKMPPVESKQTKKPKNDAPEFGG